MVHAVLLLHTAHTEIVLDVFVNPLPERDDTPIGPDLTTKRMLLTGNSVVHIPRVWRFTSGDKDLQVHRIIIAEGDMFHIPLKS